MSKKTLKFEAMDRAVLTKYIGETGKQANTLRGRIQLAAVNAVYYAIQYGDVRFAGALLDAVGKGVRRASLVMWFQNRGPIALIGKEIKLFKREKFAELTSDGQVTKLLVDADYFDKLLAANWDDEKPEEQAPAPLDVQADVEKLIARIVRNNAKKPDDATKAPVVHGGLLDFLLDAVESFKKLESGEQDNKLDTVDQVGE